MGKGEKGISSKKKRDLSQFTWCFYCVMAQQSVNLPPNVIFCAFPEFGRNRVFPVFAKNVNPQWTHWKLENGNTMCWARFPIFYEISRVMTLPSTLAISGEKSALLVQNGPIEPNYGTTERKSAPAGHFFVTFQIFYEEPGVPSHLGLVKT